MCRDLIEMQLKTASAEAVTGFKRPQVTAVVFKRNHGSGAQNLELERIKLGFRRTRPSGEPALPFQILLEPFLWKKNKSPDSPERFLTIPFAVLEDSFNVILGRSCCGKKRWGS
ncbi:hypothetical protein L1987_17713 [Smallanthus sonchifolius]|uniref:Uncharacterized protein n=1 Tax=Smallanthus sonchifolius TaxID=185202 RepID=A0ACB9IY95_9ASTR|nr:hypothetical protein L1987_17713 [Smallanthus sonchifolius]